MQGLPEWFDFVDQSNPLTYKQLGNGVNVGAVYNVIRAQVLRDIDLLEKMPGLTRSILGAPANPDETLSSYKEFFEKDSAKKGEISQGLSKVNSVESA